MAIPTAQATTTTPYGVTLTSDLGHEWLADEPLELGGANIGPHPITCCCQLLGLALR